ncbi:MAG: hypothetical protein ABL931_09350 [Usitatibacteraceae bacterium]
MQKLPRRTTGDAVQAVVKAVAGAVPIGGSALTGLLETVFAPPLERRRDKWLGELAEVVERLESELGPGSAALLAGNEAFISAAIQATQIAYRTHQDAKLHALKCAVFNSATLDDVSEDRQAVFLRIVDELTPSHLRVLSLYSKPETWLRVPDYPDDGWGRSAPSDAIFPLVPSLDSDPEFYEQIARDLQTRGLVKQGLLTHFKILKGGTVDPKTTEFGEALLLFIAESTT